MLLYYEEYARVKHSSRESNSMMPSKFENLRAITFETQEHHLSIILWPSIFLSNRSFR